jgi:serine/threonine protein phosphatase 1
MACPPLPSRHWVIGDVHGCASVLLDLIAVLPPDDLLVLCGDVINRGPQIELTMQVAWSLVQRGRAVWLRGNHEQRLLEALAGGSWLADPALAGCDTYRQLGEARCRLWQERLASLPLAYWGDGWVATHAGFDPIRWVPDLSIRRPFWDRYDGRFGEVVIGHTPVERLERSDSGIVKVDTGACYGGRLTAYCPEIGAQRSVPGLRGKQGTAPASWDPRSGGRAGCRC